MEESANFSTTLQNDTIFQTLSILQRQKTREGIRLGLVKHFLPTWKKKKNIFHNREPFKKRIEFCFEFFRKTFLMKVSGKSNSAENPEESFMLVKRFVASTN